MATIEDAGAARPTQIRVRIIEGRPFVSDFPYRLKSGAAWPTAPVLHFNGPSGVITWTSVLSDGGKLATVTATKAEVDTLLGHSSRGIAQLDDPSTGRLWAAGDYFAVSTAWAGGTAPTALADGAVVVDDRLVIMGGEGGTGGPVSWAEVTGKPSSYPPSSHRHDASEIDNLPSGGTATWSTLTGKPSTFPPDVEGTQDIVGAMVAAAGGAYDDGAGTITLPSSGAAAGPLELFSTLPASPVQWQEYPYRVTDGTTYPGSIQWASGAPVITGWGIVLLIWDGTTWRGEWAEMAAVTPPADTAGPTGGSLDVTGSGDAGSTRTLTVSGAADPSGLHATPYRFSTDGGTTYTAWQSAAAWTSGPLSAGTYSPRAQVRDTLGNATTLTAADFTVAAGADTTAPDWSATFTLGTPTQTSVVATASAMATDAVGVTGYEVSYDDGTSWASISPSGSDFTLAGTAGTTYSTTRLRAHDAAGNRSSALSVPSYTMASPPAQTGLADAILALNPTAYWPLTETTGTQAADLSGNGHHGTYAGTYTLGGTTGLFTPNATGWVEVPDHDDLSVAGSPATWFAIARIGGSSRRFLVTKGNSSQYEWQLYQTTNKMEMSILDSAGNIVSGERWPNQMGDATRHAYAASTPTPALGQRFAAYVDSGTPVASTALTPGTGTPVAGTAPVRIAARGDGAAAGWIGEIGHVAFFRAQLSTSEIAALIDAARAEGLIP